METHQLFRGTLRPNAGRGGLPSASHHWPLPCLQPISDRRSDKPLKLQGNTAWKARKHSGPSAWTLTKRNRSTRWPRHLKGAPGDAQIADRRTRARRSSVRSVGSSGFSECGHSDAGCAGSVFTASCDVGPVTALSGLLAINSGDQMIPQKARPTRSGVLSDDATIT
jgi:hypothetical protein